MRQNGYAYMSYVNYYYVSHFDSLFYTRQHNPETKNIKNEEIIKPSAKQ